MLTITKQSDYGILLISSIYKKNKLVNLSELIKETKLPKRFLARIAADLVKSKLLISREGKNGGYLISENIKTISLYDYLKIFNIYLYAVILLFPSNPLRSNPGLLVC